MILVMLGTNPYAFHRLLDAVNVWGGKTGEEIIAQTGHTPTEGITFKCADFVSHTQMVKWITDAELVICQGGFGSLKDALSAGKPVIAVPRIPELSECVDSQIEIVEALVEKKRVIPLYDVAELDEAVRLARKFCTPASAGSRLPDLIAELVSATKRPE